MKIQPGKVFTKNLLFTDSSTKAFCENMIIGLCEGVYIEVSLVDGVLLCFYMDLRR